MLQELKKMTKSSQKFKKHADKKRHYKSFEVGDLVMIKICKVQFGAGQNNKLQPRKMGSFPVSKRINDNAYVI